MRRVLSAVLWVAACAGPVCAQPLGVEVGLGGVFPAGGWTRCRIIGLDDVADGDAISVHVSGMFEARMGVSKGVAEGLILMPDEAPAIEIELPGSRRVALPADALRGLRGVRDKLPAIFLGENPPDESQVVRLLEAGDIFPIRMTPEEFLARAPGDVEWVRVFVLGKMSAEGLESLRRHSSHLSSCVLVAKPEYVTGWLEQSGFERVGELSVCRRERAAFLPVPAGSVRPELYDIFGPPVWPQSARRSVALSFGAVLLSFAVFSVLTAGRGAGWNVGLFSTTGGGLVIAWLLGMGLSATLESVSLFEGVEGTAGGVRTSLFSEAVLRRGEQGMTSRQIASISARMADITPVASTPRQWVEHGLVLTRMNALEWDLSALSREVFVKFDCGAAPQTDSVIDTDGDSAWTNEMTTEVRGVWPFRKVIAHPSSIRVVSRQFSEYLAERRHADVRVDEVRRGMLRYWREHRFRTGVYRIGWTQADTDQRSWSAGMMVVTRLRGSSPGNNPNP